MTDNKSNNDSIFNSCINIINDDINEDINDNIKPLNLDPDEYDMMMIMRFKDSDVFSIDPNNPHHKKMNHQTHIPILGNCLSFFPVITNTNYIKKKQNTFTKSLYTLAAPFTFYGADIKHIINNYDNNSYFNKVDKTNNEVILSKSKNKTTKHKMSLRDKQTSYASIKVSFHTGIQIELGIRNETGLSSKDFMGLKKLAQTNDYLVILKSHKCFKYTFILLDKHDNPPVLHPWTSKDNYTVIKNTNIMNSRNYRSFETDIKPEAINNIKTGADNEIYYGAPGTGKSYAVNKLVGGSDQPNVFRTTFYPEYDHSDFVGQIMPSINYGNNYTKSQNISYMFYPGPFTQALTYALEHPNNSTYLIIEELSRANASSVFGDILQLLDRDKLGVSDYSINNTNISHWIKSHLNLYKLHNNELCHKLYNEIQNNKIRLPSNMFIIATMNTSDQNVTPLDSAFKRRFSEHYVSVIPNFDINKNEYASIVANTKLSINTKNNLICTSWRIFYQYLDYYIAHVLYPKEDSEDKQIGMFFMQFTKNLKHNKSQIKNKLLQYLWNDVNDPYVSESKQIFIPNLSFAEIYKQFGTSQIFSDSFITGLRKYIRKYNSGNDTQSDNDKKNISKN